MRSALARAAIRLGSSTMIFLPRAHGSSSSASGARVVLPAPGGATSTAALLPTSVRANSSSTASIGSGVSKVRGKVSPARHARPCAGHPVFPSRSKRDVDGHDVWREDALRAFAVMIRKCCQRASLPRFGGAADAFVNKAKRGHVFGAVDVAQVDENGMSQLTFQTLQIERAVLRPFGHHHQ